MDKEMRDHGEAGVDLDALRGAEAPLFHVGARRAGVP
jgi:hypothetical protein